MTFNFSSAPLVVIATVRVLTLAAEAFLLSPLFESGIARLRPQCLASETRAASHDRQPGDSVLRSTPDAEALTFKHSSSR